MRFTMGGVVGAAMVWLLAGCQTAVPNRAVSGGVTNAVSATGASQRNQPQPAIFPAQQRTPDNPKLISRGEALYGVSCRGCHGADLRGGDLGGPNLLRSQWVFNDQAGELIKPIVQQGRATPGMTPMPALALPDDDVRAVAAYLHTVLATAQGQGAPPPGAEEVELDILVGDAAIGRAYFEEQCASCHSASGDLRGIASRVGSTENLQNSWVAGRRWGRPSAATGPSSRPAVPANAPPDPSRRQVTVTVISNHGERVSGTLMRIDDFIVSLRDANGLHRSFPRTGAAAVTAVAIDDPLRRHRELLSELNDATMHDVTAYLATLK